MTSPLLRRTLQQTPGVFAERAGDFDHADATIPKPGVELDLQNGWPAGSLEPGYNAGTMAKGAFAGAAPRAEELAPSDDILAKDIHDAMATAAPGRFGEVHVDVHEGEVTLTGTVVDVSREREVVNLITAVRGVTSVRNDLIPKKRPAAST